jgi:hypothetical protein
MAPQWVHENGSEESSAKGIAATSNGRHRGRRPDEDWRKLVVEVNSTDKPSADLVSSAVYAKIPLG